MVTRQESLDAIKSWWEDDIPTATEVNHSDDTSATYARGMLDLHLSCFSYDGNKDIDDLRAQIWEEIFPPPKDRFWVHDSLEEDQPDVPLPFGEYTVGIVDEEQGGVVLYVHSAHAYTILAALMKSAETPE